MTGTIYLVQKDDTLIKMNQMAYQQEEDFQNLLVKFPELLSGEQINSTEPRRWLLIGREVPVPSEAEGDARWFLDHLFLDQDAIPTLVEVKRKSDTRLRREVVGQMLDYVANAVVYWDEKKIYELFEATCKASDCKPEEILFKKLGIEKEQAIFWQNAGLNLKQGKVRLVFVADMIPPELQRIIEFLNERMTPTEVLGVEIRQYTGGGFSTHIPRVIGQTSEAQVTKSRPSGARRTWNEEAFFNDIQKRVERDELNHDNETVVIFLNFSEQPTEVEWRASNCLFKVSPRDEIKEKAIHLDGLGGVILK